MCTKKSPGFKLLMITLVLFGSAAHAANFINNRIAFQGLLQQSTGVSIPDGTYNAQFKIHTGGVTNTTVWTKSPVAITLTGGVFSTVLSGADNSSVVLVPSLLDVSGSDATTSLMVDVAVDFTGGTSYTSQFNNIAIQAVPTAMIANTCMVSKAVAAGAVTAAGMTAGDYSTVINAGSYAISITGNAATATTASSVTGGVSVPTATNISYGGATGNFDQSGSSGTFKTGSGAVSINGATTISGTNAFTTGTGAVTLNGATTLAAGKDLIFAAGAGNFNQSSSTGTFATGSGAVFLNGATTLAAGKDLIFAAGAGNFNQSSSTGTFATSSGAGTLNGATTIAAGKDFTFAAGAGNLNMASSTGALSTGTGAVNVNGAVTFAAAKGVTVTAGTGAFDFSGGTGLFKTSTGAVTLGGSASAVTVGGATGTLAVGGTAFTSQVGVNAGYTTAGTANAQTVTLAPALATLTAGQMVTFKVGTSLTNTGATTLQVNSLTATAVKYVGQALTGGELIAGNTYSVMYDGSAYQLISPVRMGWTSAATSLTTVTTPAANTSNVNGTTITITGAAVGDNVVCTPSSPVAGYIWNGYVSGTGTITIILSCVNGASACGTWTTPSFKCQVLK